MYFLALLKLKMTRKLYRCVVLAYMSDLEVSGQELVVVQQLVHCNLISIHIPVLYTPFSSKMISTDLLTSLLSSSRYELIRTDLACFLSHANDAKAEANILIRTDISVLL